MNSVLHSGSIYPRQILLSVFVDVCMIVRKVRPRFSLWAKLMNCDKQADVIVIKSYKIS